MGSLGPRAPWRCLVVVETWAPCLAHGGRLRVWTACFSELPSHLLSAPGGADICGLFRPEVFPKHQ